MKARPTFHMARAPVTTVTKRSPLSLLTSQAPRARQEKYRTKHAGRKEPQQSRDGIAEKEARRQKHYTEDDEGVAGAYAELHMARHSTGAVAH